jgi:hypothetical protein
MRVISGKSTSFRVLRCLLELALRRRDEPPVVAPRVVEDVHDDGELVRDVVRVHLAHLHLGHGGDLVVRSLRPDRDLARRVAPRVEVLELGEAGSLDQARLIGPVVRHHDHRRPVEAVDQAAELLVDAEAEGASQLLHAP